MIIRNLADVDPDTLFKGFERAFCDYEIQFDRNEVFAMLHRRGYDARLSFAAFEEEEIVAFTFNGIGSAGDIPTAYDTGTGTAGEYRGQGLAGKIFNYSIPFLRDAGIRQYLLEVLLNNEKAIAVYRRLGFEVIREFDCFRQSLGNVSGGYHDAEINSCEIRTIDFGAVARAQDFCDFIPSWQNSIDSIWRGRAALTMYGAFIGGMLAGYCVCDSLTGDITQLAVGRQYRRRGVGSRLLRKAMEHMRTDFIKVLNVSSTDTTLHPFLESKNIPLASRQLEMKKDL